MARENPAEHHRRSPIRNGETDLTNLTFYMKDNYSERMEDILLVVNESRQENPMKDFSEWERLQLRQYVNNFITIYRKWENDSKLADPRTNQISEVPNLKFYPDRILLDSASSKARTFKRVLPLGSKQVDWLKKAVAFYKAVQLYFNAKEKHLPPVNLAEGIAKSVGETVQSLLDDQIWRLIAQADQKELDEEEQKSKPKGKKAQKMLTEGGRN